MWFQYSVMNSGFLLRGQKKSKRQTAFFLPIDPRDNGHENLEKIDFLCTTSCTMHGRNIKTRYIGSTSIFWFKKDWQSNRLDRMQSFLKKHFQLLIPKVVGLKTGEVSDEKVSMSLRHPPNFVANECSFTVNNLFFVLQVCVFWLQGEVKINTYSVTTSWNWDRKWTLIMNVWWQSMTRTPMTSCSQLSMIAWWHCKRRTPMTTWPLSLTSTLSKRERALLWFFLVCTSSRTVAQVMILSHFIHVHVHVSVFPHFWSPFLPSRTSCLWRS